MFIKLVKTALFTASFILACNLDAAKTIDVSDAQKDMRVMSGILETTLKDAKEDFPGRPVIRTTYLAEQGYLFTIRLNGLGSLGIPGVAAWDSGRLELDIPEIIEEAFAAIDYDGVVDVPEPPAPFIAEREASSREYQQQMREMREQQRALRREIAELSRDLRRLDDDKKRDKLEGDIANLEKKLNADKQAYYDKLNNYKQEKLGKQIAKTDKAVAVVIETLCDYGTTIRSLKKGEKLNLLIQGGLTADGESKDQMFVFDANDVRGCRSAEKLQKDALYYIL